MKTPTLIILSPDTVGIDKATEEKLLPFKSTEEPHYFGKWDYWTIFPEYKFENNNRPANLHPSELNDYVNYISSSEVNFQRVGAILDLEGKWHEMEDFGWTMVNRSGRNEEAAKLWYKHVAEIIKNSEGQLGLIIVVHI